MNFRKNCAQLAQSMSAAQAGSRLPLTRRNSAPSSNGRITSTAVPVSAAVGKTRASTARSARLYGTWMKSSASVFIIFSICGSSPCE